MPFSNPITLGRPLTPAELADNFDLSQTLHDETQTARDQAVSAAGIFASTTAGITGTTNGQYFCTPSVDSAKYLVLYRNNSGTAVEVSTYPSKAAVDAVLTAGLRNRIINGNFIVRQRNYVSGAATSAGQYTFDRWKVSGTGGVTFATSANKTTVTIPSGQTLQQVIEGANLETGTYVLSWEGTAQGRIAGGSYGSSGSVTASITGGTNTTIEFNSGTVALVQLERGAAATPFEQRPIGMELSLCQRYYQRIASPRPGIGFAVTSTTAQIHIPFVCEMRAAPSSLDQSGTAADYTLLRQAVVIVASSTAPTYVTAGTSSAAVQFTVASGLTAGEALMARLINSAYLGFSAEL